MIDSRTELKSEGWSDPITKGSVAYFRIQGPTVQIEYAPQGGTAYHVHTFYRDPTNDYGLKIFRPQAADFSDR